MMPRGRRARVYYVDADLGTALEIACPECERIVATQGNAVCVWITTHSLDAGNCPASGHEVRRLPVRT